MWGGWFISSLVYWFISLDVFVSSSVVENKHCKRTFSTSLELTTPSIKKVLPRFRTAGLSNGRDREGFDVSSLATGVYIVEARNEKEVYNGITSLYSPPLNSTSTEKFSGFFPFLSL